MHPFAIADRPIFLAEHRPQSLACAGHCPESTITARRREMGIICGSRPTCQLTPVDRPESGRYSGTTGPSAAPDLAPTLPPARVGGEVVTRDHRAITDGLAENQG